MNKKSLIIVQIIIILALFGALGYYFYNEYYVDSKNNNEQDQSVEPQLEFAVLKEGVGQEVIDIWQRDFQLAWQARKDSVDGFNMSAWLTLGHILRQAENYEEAIKAYNYVSYMRPKNSPSFYSLGIIYSSDAYQDWQQAEKNYLIAMSNQPDDLDYIQSLYELYRFKYKEKKYLADDVLLEGLEKNPDNEFLLALLANYYENEGEKGKAREYYLKVLEVNPENSGAERALDRLLIIN